MVCEAWLYMICPKCKGVGYHVVHKHAVFDIDNDWDCKYFNGERYRFKLCKKCNGKGEI